MGSDIDLSELRVHMISIKCLQRKCTLSCSSSILVGLKTSVLTCLTQSISLWFLWPCRKSSLSVITLCHSELQSESCPSHKKAACMQIVAVNLSEIYFKAPVGTNMNNLSSSWKSAGNIASLVIVLLCQGCLQKKKEGLKLRPKCSNLYALSYHWHKSVFWHLSPTGFISSPTATKGIDTRQVQDSTPL